MASFKSSSASHSMLRQQQDGIHTCLLTLLNSTRFSRLILLLQGLSCVVQRPLSLTLVSPIPIILQPVTVLATASMSCYLKLTEVIIWEEFGMRVVHKIAVTRRSWRNAASKKHLWATDLQRHVPFSPFHRIRRRLPQAKPNRRTDRQALAEIQARRKDKIRYQS